MQRKFYVFLTYGCLLKSQIKIQLEGNSGYDAVFGHLNPEVIISLADWVASRTDQSLPNRAKLPISAQKIATNTIITGEDDVRKLHFYPDELDTS